ncbi:MAG: glycoside hydrolase family 3 C-terminal domain-containing protein [Clostridia bacterium]|nr:glycoside hydrolase family 3 C-terminal domain-containing protein [Clostridia bacterium]
MNRELASKLAEELVDKMTVEEAAMQLRFDAPAIPRLGIPEYNWWNECLHGVARAGMATVFPQAIGLGATFDKELFTEMGEVISTEARAKYNEHSRNGDRDIYKGLTFWTPNVNLFRDPRWGRGQETYGEDPTLISDLAVPFIKALQGDGEYMKIAACAKHFAVHSGPEATRHFFDATATKKDLYETYLPQFEACVRDAEVESVMGAYNRTNGEPCCANKPLMVDILRGKWDFKGHFVSDCWAVRDFHENHKVTSSPEESAALAINTGCDLNCGCTYQKLINAYNMGLVTEETIRQAAVRLFTTRYLLGMFADKTEYDDLSYADVCTDENLELAYKAAVESMVLLKNSNSFLPLDSSKVKTVGVIGPNADSKAALVGNYHGTASGYTTVLDGIREVGKKDGFRVLYTEGCHLFECRPDGLSLANHRLTEAKIIAEHSDVVVLCLGLDETLEGEEGDTGNQYASGDKLDLKYPQSQLNLIEAVLSVGTPVILVSMTGSAMDLCEFNSSENTKAVIQAWYPGSEGGRALADVIFGYANPSGKLPVTFYKNLDNMPEFTDYSMKERTYRFITYEPLYPFGYGLTYGECNLLEAGISAANVNYSSATAEGINIKAVVENVGNKEVSEVLQVYVKVNSQYEVVNPKLAAFTRVDTEPGEKKTVEIKVPYKAFKVIDDEGNTVNGNGADIYVGFSQPDSLSAKLTGKNTVKFSV